MPDRRTHVPDRLALLIRDFATRLLEADELLSLAQSQVALASDEKDDAALALRTRICAWRSDFVEERARQEEIRREEDPEL